MRADRRALLLFFLVACLPPWIGWSLITFGAVPQNAPYAPLLYITGWGCSAAGLIATYASEGRGAVRSLLSQAVRVRVPARWWLYVLVVPPAMQTAIALASFRLAGARIVMHPAALVSLASPAMLLPFFFGPFGEEFGWRGFLLPRFVQRFSVLPACLIVGVIWALWHWPLAYQVMGGLVWVAICMSFMIGAVYLRTKSLLLAMIMHWNFDAMAQLAPKLFPGVPVAGSAAFVWATLGIGGLFAALTIPALLAFQRGDLLPPIAASTRSRAS